jgi:cob(I)alamin adenosyltransferase
MKIYTKTGDQGETGLYGGMRVSKFSPRVKAYGDVDELNSVLGRVVAETPHDPFRQSLRDIQSHLFVLGAQLASPQADPKIEVITAAHVDSLERQIDVMQQTLSPLKNFILPGGGLTAANLHLARTVCRRAERSAVELSQIDGERVDKWVLIYLNRLSDFLFVMARLSNHIEKIPDVPWISKGS